MITMAVSIRKMLTLALVTWVSVASPVFAEISLSGEQDGFLESGNYLVTGPITVKEGTTLSFAPGSIVRFKPYAGIVVKGSLKCIGTENLPILLTSENHRVSGSLSSEAPAPFDWNGILVIDSLASLDFEYVHVIYSTFGLDIKSLKSSIRLKDAVFDENGQCNVRVEGEQLDVKDNLPFSYSLSAKADSAIVVSPPSVPQPEPTAAVRDTIPVAKEMGKGAWKLPARIGSGILALAGTAFAFYFDSKVSDNQEKYESVNNVKDQPLLLTYQNKRDEAGANRTISIIGALIGVCGFSITFLF